MASILSVSEARALVADALCALGTEHVSLTELPGRVLARDVVSSVAVPAFDNSAMDGYAVRAAEVGARAMPVAFAVTAGDDPLQPLPPGAVARIFTGAKMPAGADAVVMQEDAARAGDQVALSVRPAPGDHVRRQGEDIQPGVTLLRRGHEIRPADVGLLASQRRSWFEVQLRPRVAIVPTGDEVVELDQPRRAAEVLNSNSHMLAAQVRAAGGVPVRCSVAGDSPLALAEALSLACRHADLVLTCGGVSVGEHDHVRNVLGARGTIRFWKVALKPGKPLAFGAYDGVPVIGLPGNPLSAFVCCALFARPAIAKLGGAPAPSYLRARLRQHAQGNPQRELVLRGVWAFDEGEPWVTTHARQGSGDLSSLAGVNALVHLPAGVGAVAAGEWAPVLPV